MRPMPAMFEISSFIGEDSSYLHARRALQGLGLFLVVLGRTELLAIQAGSSSFGCSDSLLIRISTLILEALYLMILFLALPLQNINGEDRFLFSFLKGPHLGSHDFYPLGQGIDLSLQLFTIGACNECGGWLRHLSSFPPHLIVTRDSHSSFS
ncbi:unnamed protein product [Sphenostylis stenocarpa]|uniref:Uncharacterized protein n=1 Tax=Sphenostylis stenocarpa TaxID=92480 RepID=A0AA86T5R2_9FABA|nr:unnamed protein product [Sphenostylis stenocarpa]